MNKAEKKAAMAACKEKKSVAGVYAITCTPTGQVWIGETANIDSQQNQVNFALKHGGLLCRSLQAVWSEQGGEAFRYRVLEWIAEKQGEEMPVYFRRKLLREMAAKWQKKMNGAHI